MTQKNHLDVMGEYKQIASPVEKPPGGLVKQEVRNLIGENKLAADIKTTKRKN